MRTIKFRAWDKKEREMLYMITQKYLWEFFDMLRGRGRNLKNILFLQFTGLKDKNGKEIYEGDIVKLDKHYDNDRLIPEHILRVLFEEGSFSLFHLEFPGSSGYIDELHSNVINDRIKIIGNIYENPELLKGVRIS